MGLIAVTASFALGAVAALWGGFAISILWHWFIAPMGAPEISAAQGAAACLIYEILHGGRSVDFDRIERVSAGDQLLEQLAVVITFPGLSLIMGAIIKSFIA